MDIRLNGFGEDAILELPPYSVGQTKSHIPVRQISTYSLIDYNGIYGTEILLTSGQRVRAGCYPDDVSRAITASSHAENTRTNEVLRLTRERDEAREECERLREAYKIVQQDCFNLTEKVIPNLRDDIEQLEDEVEKRVPIHVALNGMVGRMQNLILALIGGLSLIGIVVMLACVLHAAE